MPVVDITSTNQFEGTLTRAGPKQVIAVHWTATWCGPCKRITPDFDKLASTFTRIKFLRVDVDKNKELAQKASVSKLPTFTFYNGSTLLGKETLQGPSASKLKEVVERLDKATNPFAGAGYALSGPSSSASSSGASASSAAPAKPKRFNPWAQKDFVPPGLRAAQEAEKRAKEEAAKAKKAKEEAAVKAKTPWADPNFKPKVAADAPPPSKPEGAAAASASTSSNAAEDDELQKALAMSLAENATAAGDGADADKMTDDNDDASTSSTAQAGNDPALLAGINQSFLTQLQDMGFGKIRSEKALILTKSKSLEAAMNWLVENESKPDVDEPLKVVGTAAGSASKKPKGKVWKPNERGRPLGWKPGDEYEDDDIDDDILKSIRKNNKYKSAEKTSNKPMTKEEKLKDLEERRARRKDDLIKEELEKQKSAHKSRVNTTKEMAELKRQRAETEQKLLLEKRKREKQREAERKKKMKEKMRREKERRKKEAEERKKRLEEIRAAKAAAGK